MFGKLPESSNRKNKVYCEGDVNCNQSVVEIVKNSVQKVQIEYAMEKKYSMPYGLDG